MCNWVAISLRFTYLGIIISFTLHSSLSGRQLSKVVSKPFTFGLLSLDHLLYIIPSTLGFIQVHNRRLLHLRLEGRFEFLRDPSPPLSLLLLKSGTREKSCLEDGMFVIC